MEGAGTLRIELGRVDLPWIGAIRRPSALARQYGLRWGGYGAELQGQGQDEQGRVHGMVAPMK
jgi:hypothetical protein